MSLASTTRFTTQPKESNKITEGIFVNIEVTSKRYEIKISTQSDMMIVPVIYKIENELKMNITISTRTKIKK